MRTDGNKGKREGQLDEWEWENIITSTSQLRTAKER